MIFARGLSSVLGWKHIICNTLKAFGVGWLGFGGFGLTGNYRFCRVLMVSIGSFKGLVLGVPVMGIILGSPVVSLTFSSRVP